VKSAQTVQQLHHFIVEECGIEIVCLSEKRLNEVNEMALNHLTLDSRKVTPGDVFFALQGEQNHGLEYLASALTKLPGLVISDRMLSEHELAIVNQYAVTVLVVKQVTEILGYLAAWFYNQPSERIKVIGITGTNGKTSSAFFTGQLLQQLGHKVALMGTLGNGPIDALQKTVNTTPDSLQVHRLLHEFAEQGMQWVVMEVSSHALCLGRVQGVKFETVALTQVTRDHIDFHGTVEDYHAAKAKLFTDYPAKHKVLNLSDAVGSTIVQKLRESKQNASSHVWTYQPQYAIERSDGFSPNLRCLKADLDTQGIHGQIQLKQASDCDVDNFSLALMGLFNIENVLCSLSILLVNGFEWKNLKPKLASITSVSGRMQKLHQQPTIILDFAHTADALEQVLSAIKAHLQNTSGKLKVVFGCGGNRDKGKRPLMGQVAESLANEVVITSDNPRDENPQSIINEILPGLVNPELALIEIDRKQAITMTLQQANQQDVILIAGKGHEDYQEINGVKYPFSDAEVVHEYYGK